METESGLRRDGGRTQAGLESDFRQDGGRT